GVTSNTICPAYVRTPLVEKQIADQARIHGISEDRVVEEIMLTEPAIKRLIEPSEVAELVAYLCSAPASFANGSSYVLDGGWSARRVTLPRPGSGLTSDEAPQAGDGAAHDQRVDLAGAFVGVDRLGVGDEPAHVVLQQDAI